MSVTAKEVSGSQSAWTHLPCKLDAGPAPTAAIGLITLPNDASIESELNAFLAIDGVRVFANRIRRPAQGTADSLREMEQHLGEAAALLVPDLPLDVIAYGCTAASMAIGPDAVAAGIRTGRPNIACTDPVSAALKGLRAFETRRIAILNPYGDEVNEVVERFVSSQGFEIVAKASFNQKVDARITRVPPQAIYDAGLELGRAPEVEGLFISCTGLRVSPVIGRLEEALGKPVVSSNQALAWDCLRLSGCEEQVEGFGKLFSHPG